MSESQNIEWKESWRDEYLKWICGFANAQGGKIYIGVNDKGQPIGLSDSKKLLEDIPNKVQTTMGIIVDVNLLTSGNNDYIEIAVSPTSYPVSYRGEYHYRTGSTKQQLTGAALTEFLISKTGFRWDAVPVEKITANDLDNDSIEIFRRDAIRSGRMSKEDLNMPNDELLDHLGLLVDDKLKRAAVMLFFKRPEKIISGSYVKIGKFGNGSDLLYQDELHGSLISIADKVIDLIYLKYLKAEITYEKDTRIETYPFPRDGVREAVFNALIHCNWADSTPIQIRIDDDAMCISNSCILPRDWTADTLMEKHRSKPYNPDIANTFFRAGYVEIWGRGIQKICEACENHGNPKPKFEVLGGGMTVTINALKPTPQSHRNHTAITPQLTATDQMILAEIQNNPSISQRKIALNIGVSYDTVRYHMKIMARQNILQKTKQGKNSCWTVIC